MKKKEWNIIISSSSNSSTVGVVVCTVHFYQLEHFIVFNETRHCAVCVTALFNHHSHSTCTLLSVCLFFVFFFNRIVLTVAVKEHNMVHLRPARVKNDGTFNIKPWTWEREAGLNINHKGSLCLLWIYMCSHTSTAANVLPPRERLLNIFMDLKGVRWRSYWAPLSH